jgi:hypothetical protein
VYGRIAREDPWRIGGIGGSGWYLRSGKGSREQQHADRKQSFEYFESIAEPFFSIAQIDTVVRYVSALHNHHLRYFRDNPFFPLDRYRRIGKRKLNFFGREGNY